MNQTLHELDKKRNQHGLNLIQVRTGPLVPKVTIKAALVVYLRKELIGIN